MIDIKKSIASVVRNLITSRPSLLTCLINNVVNYTALAESLKRDVKEELGTDVSTNAIKVTLTRFGKELRRRAKEIEDPIASIMARSAIRLETDLVVITINKEYALPALSELMKIMRRARFTQITQGVNSYTIVVSRELSNEVKQVIKEASLDIVEDQTAIILVSPKEILTTPGVVSYVTALLTWNGINITQIISCHLDTIIIINSSDALKAYSLLQTMINFSRKVQKR